MNTTSYLSRESYPTDRDQANHAQISRKACSQGKLWWDISTCLSAHCSYCMSLRSKDRNRIFYCHICISAKGGHIGSIKIATQNFHWSISSRSIRYHQNQFLECNTVSESQKPRIFRSWLIGVKLTTPNSNPSQECKMVSESQKLRISRNWLIGAQRIRESP